MWDFIRNFVTDYQAYCFNDFNLKYADLIRIVENNKRILNEFSIKRAKILVMATSKLQYTIAALSIWASDNVLIANSQSENVTKIIEEVNPDYILTDGAKAQDLAPNIPRIMINEEHCLEIIDKKSITAVDYLLHEKAIAIFSTSGTSGNPKLIMLSKENFISNLLEIRKYFILGEDDKIAILRPVGFVSVLISEIVLGLISNAQIFFYESIFSPKDMIDFINKNSITSFSLTPTLMYNLSIIRTSMTTVKQVSLVGEKMQNVVYESLKKSYKNIEFYYGYGMSECSPRISYLASELFYEKKGSCGKILSNIECKMNNTFFDTNVGKTVGEIWVKGPSIMLGYYGSTTSFQDGWLSTGDLGYFEDNFLYIICRNDDVINRAGVKIYPITVENSLLAINSIEDVFVYGESNVIYGNQIVAEIVCNDHCKQNEIMTLIKRLNLRPDIVNFVDAINRTSSGKKIKHRDL